MRTFTLLSSLLTLAACVPACSSKGSSDQSFFGAPGNPSSTNDPNADPIGAGTGTSTGGMTGDVSSPGEAPVTTETITEIVCRTEKVPATGCEDVTPPQGNSCEDWKEWGQCGLNWFETEGFCRSTCGTCEGAMEKEVCEEVTRVVVVGGSTGTATERPTNPGATAPPVSGGQNGWASRYWDCCKPHCAWEENAAPAAAMNMCSIGNQPLSDANAPSSCDGGSAYTCFNLAPWAVSDTLAYGFAATPVSNSCGKCYQLDFTGEGQHNPADPGSASLAGKSMIVQAVNIGYDVGNNQFDILIPGGGVGAFDGCSKQWGTGNLGETYGGFLAACKGSVSCLTNKCNDIFSDKPDLLAGCLFHAEWMAGADNPKLRYAEVDCPPELEQTTGMAL